MKRKENGVWGVACRPPRGPGVAACHPRGGIIMPRLLQKVISKNFKFSHDITTSSELRFGSGI
jgi:hypothetical protein